MEPDQELELEALEAPHLKTAALAKAVWRSPVGVDQQAV